MNGGMRVAAYEKSKSVKLKSISTMTEGTIWRQILLFSIPLILGNLLQQMYNTVDSIIVGNFVGSNALAAVGSSGWESYKKTGKVCGIELPEGLQVRELLYPSFMEQEMRMAFSVLHIQP